MSQGMQALNGDLGDEVTLELTQGITLVPVENWEDVVLFSWVIAQLIFTG
jgi:hypothetical protein